MVSASEIRQKLAGFLAGEIDLDTFEDWIVRNTWDVHQWGDEDARNLSYAIELRLSEHSSGHLPESELKRELRPFVTNYVAHVSLGNALPVNLGSDIKWSRGVLRVGEVSDILPVVVFG